MKQFIRISVLSLSLSLIGATSVVAHSDRNEKRPQTYAEAFIPMTRQDFEQNRYRQSLFRHPPGNVRAEDIATLFAGKVLVIDRGRNFSKVPGIVDHALKVVFIGNIGKNQRYIWCSYDFEANYFTRKNKSKWSPVKIQHDGFLWPRFDPSFGNDRHHGLSPLYEAESGRIVFYRHRNKTWHPWNPGHIQERLPAAVYTICPDFPSPEELGVKVNSKQTAVTYDKLLEQDRGQRVLRPDLVTLNPLEIAD